MASVFNVFCLTQASLDDASASQISAPQIRQPGTASIDEDAGKLLASNGVSGGGARSYQGQHAAGPMLAQPAVRGGAASAQGRHAAAAGAAGGATALTNSTAAQQPAADPYWRPPPSVLDEPSTSSRPYPRTPTPSAATQRTHSMAANRLAATATTPAPSQNGHRSPHNSPVKFRARVKDPYAASIAIMSAVKGSNSWRELAVAVASHGQSRDWGPVHASAALTHLAQLAARAQRK